MLNYLLYFIALFGLSQSANLVKMAQAPIEVLGFWRLFFCALLFLPWALRFKSLRPLFQADRRHDLWMGLISGTFFFLHLWTFFYASKNTSIANCMIIFSINPLFTAAGAYLFFGEKFTPRLAMAYVLAFFGIYWLVSHSVHFDQGLVKGDLMALLSALLVSVYLLSGKKLRHSLDNPSFSVFIYSVCAFWFGVTALLRGIEFTGYETNTWWAIAGLVVIPTLLGHSLFMYLIKYMNINLMTCGKLIEPVMSSMVAWILFKEHLKTSTWIAFIFTSASVLVLFAPWSILKQKLQMPKSK